MALCTSDRTVEKLLFNRYLMHVPSVASVVVIVATPFYCLNNYTQNMHLSSPIRSPFLRSLKSDSTL